MALEEIEIVEEREAFEDFNWPGWPLDKNTFGNEFDIEARARMVAGRDLFRLFTSKFCLGPNILEVGPFFSPTVSVDRLQPNGSVAYLENDRHALVHMRDAYADKSNVVVADGNIESIYLNPLTSEGSRLKGLVECSNSILLSQVINYVDYKRLVKAMSDIVNGGTEIFINNVVEYGLPALFHPGRPRSILDTVATLKDCGLEILSYELVSAPRIGDGKRLLLRARFKGLS